jgi:hypothetical protein
MKIKPYIRNEWGKLKEIIVGRPEFAQIPTIRDKSLHTIDYANYTDEQFRKIPYGTYPNWMIEETIEDLNDFSKTLEGLGVKVHRPALIDWSETYTESGKISGTVSYDAADAEMARLAADFDMYEGYFEKDEDDREVFDYYSDNFFLGDAEKINESIKVSVKKALKEQYLLFIRKQI